MTAATAANPWLITLAWTPEQNGGRVSIMPSRAPIFSIVQQLDAELGAARPDTWDDVRRRVAADHDLTFESLLVLRQLVHDIYDLIEEQPE